MAIRFKLDENLPRDAEALLRDAGHEVQSVFEERLGGRPDPQILDAARSEARVLITFDLDFADIRLYPPASHTGIWVLRGLTQSIENTLSLLRGALSMLQMEDPRSRLWIVEHGAFAYESNRNNVPNMVLQRTGRESPRSSHTAVAAGR